jgi:hypothetical protein
MVFTRLVRKFGTHRDGISFYTLRHVFRTVADAARDPVAIDLIMGHADPSMGGHYRERVEDSRLRAVAEHVRAWVFGKASDGGTTGRPDNPASGSSAPIQESVGEARAASGSQQSAPVLSADTRPTLRLYVG